MKIIQQLENTIDTVEAVERYGDPAESVSAAETANEVLLLAARFGYESVAPVNARNALAELGKALAWAQTANPRPMLTPPQLAREWGVSPDKVRAWIQSGELKARNVSQGTRPRYLIDRSDIESFRQREKPAPRPRRQRSDPDIIEFYQ